MSSFAVENLTNGCTTLGVILPLTQQRLVRRLESTFPVAAIGLIQVLNSLPMRFCHSPGRGELIALASGPQLPRCRRFLYSGQRGRGVRIPART
jgi:hypothetical protein